MQASICAGQSKFGAALRRRLSESRFDIARESAIRVLALSGRTDSCVSYRVIRNQPFSNAATSFRPIGNIANSGKTDGLWAKLGRFSFFSKSATSSERGIVAGSTMGPEEMQGAAANPKDADKLSTAGGEAQPVLFLSHGSPMLLVQKGLPSRDFIVNLPKQLKKPKAILIISAHWDTTEPTVTSVTKNDTIYDFYGFPRELYKISYNAPGDPELAQRTVDLLRAGGFPKAKVTESRGLDHGAWVPLILMYPNLDVPIVQLSVQYRKSGAHHYKLGQALAPLKDEDVLVIGSGSTTHNLRSMNFEGGPPDPHALGFDNWLNDALVEHRDGEVINFTEKAPYAREMHPTPDHFLPIIVALGAAGEDAECKRIHNSFELRTMSMSSFGWQSKSAPSQAVATSAY